MVDLPIDIYELGTGNVPANYLPVGCVYYLRIRARFYDVRIDNAFSQCQFWAKREIVVVTVIAAVPHCDCAFICVFIPDHNEFTVSGGSSAGICVYSVHGDVLVGDDSAIMRARYAWIWTF